MQVTFEAPPGGDGAAYIDGVQVDSNKKENAEFIANRLAGLMMGRIVKLSSETYWKPYEAGVLTEINSQPHLMRVLRHLREYKSKRYSCRIISFCWPLWMAQSPSIQLSRREREQKVHSFIFLKRGLKHFVIGTLRQNSRHSE